ncbi:hypothetical protein IMZ11_37525 [Microtetraspora sp. AC03309]|uniref:ABC transporter permease n=1 Tax=Microtetraspora sp. AC03309 TaxID=2779376 RepID=UPI001E42CA23|nr:hypothetical protein [Microtetraspora sp. AC03309]MCC5581321.1 hypothetical protein [Microtetraspora sp. AC03309]
MIATLRYEFLMQIRRPVMWIVYGLAFAAIVATMWPSYRTLDLGSGGGHDPKLAMLASAKVTMSLLAIVYGCLLADRLIRDRRLGVASILDASPSNPGGRLIGKYLGVCAATAAPIALVFFGRAVVYTFTEGKVETLAWSLAVFATVILPGLIFLGALALAGPLLMPPLPFRVLFVGYWFWGNLIPADMMPTLSHTIFAATGDYAAYGLFDRARPDGVAYGWPDAALNFLRPAATPAVAVLWMGVMVALATAILLLARLHAARSES